MIVFWPRRLQGMTIFLLAAMLAIGLISNARAATPAQVDGAIARAVQYIYAAQRHGGHWETDAKRTGDDHRWNMMQGDTFGGYTALATYALLAAGQSPNDPRIKSAIQFLKTCDMVGVYAIGLRLQVWLLIPHDSPEIRSLIRKDAKALLDGVNGGVDAPGTNAGLWDYLGKGTRIDHSVSQYGILGLWAAQQSGAANVGLAQWKLFESAWRRDQMPTGGWGYSYQEQPTLSMTAAGVASLFIINDYLGVGSDEGCTGGQSDPWIDRGLAWIAAHYDDVGQNSYAMYGLERIGAASGYSFFTNHDWYSDLSDRLVKSQGREGSWAGGYAGSTPLDGTCFGLLFLAKGRAPVLMNKLQYQEAQPASVLRPESKPLVALPAIVRQDWNQRPRDAANLAAWIGEQTETKRNWQIVDFEASDTELHESPILYVTGSDAVNLEPGQTQTLKRFVQQGGMILANADCGREAFSQSIEALGEKIFGGKFRELPSAHPIFTHQQFPAAQWRQRPRVLGLSNGARELIVLLPDADPARWWQNPRGAAGHEDAYELGADLYEYASDRHAWDKGAGYLVRPDPQIKATRQIKVARIQAGSGWNPEPGGWIRLAAVMHNEDQLDLATFPAIPGEGSLAAARVAHWTGTSGFKLSDAAAIEIRSFVQNGGTLVVDAAGGSPAFADAAEQELKTLFGADTAIGLDQPLGLDAPVFNLPGHKIMSFAYRAWTRRNSAGPLDRPRLRGMTIGHRIAVFFSREDLSAGLVGEPVDGIVGYAPRTATDIMRNILLYVEAGRRSTTKPGP